MPSSKYSIIIMQDTKQPKRLRVSASLLNFVAFLALCMPVMILLSVIMNFTLYSQIREEERAQLELKKELNNSAQITARLANLEQFLQEQSPVTLENLLPESNATYPVISDNEAVAHAREFSQQAQVRYRSGEPILADPWAGQADRAQTLQAPAEEAKKEQTLAEQRFVDEGIVSLENIILESSTRNMRFSFNLYNTGVLPHVAGANFYTLILATGEEIDLAEATNTFFRINRFKKVVSETPLPLPYDELKDAQIQLDIVVDEKSVYTILLPLTLKK